MTGRVSVPGGRTAEEAFEAAKLGKPEEVVYRVVMVIDGKYGYGTRCDNIEEARRFRAIRASNMPDASFRILRTVTAMTEDWVE